MKKQTGSSAILYVYDESGQLIGEYDETGATIQEYIWHGTTLVGIMKGAATAPALFSVEVDHLGTPRQVRDANQDLRWEWTFDAFGRTPPTEDPSSLGAFALNLRYPGQYYDVETDFHYNWHRDYDPSTGRYIQSDLIGLDGSLI